MSGYVGNHPCALRAALCLLAAFLVAGTPSQAQLAQTKTSALAPVSLTCTAAITAENTIVPQQANMLCSAAHRALASLTLPLNAPVALHLTVTAANDRGAGIAGKWVFANGQACAIAPLNTRFFDKGAKSALRMNFIQVFFQTNPVPSAPDISTHSIRNFRCALSAPSANLLAP